jgi:hypothetical protein
MTSLKIGDAISRRTVFASLGAGGLGLATAATARPAGAQASATPPFVGLWTQKTSADLPPGFINFTTIHADGTVSSIHSFAGPGVGAWRATGERTADWTIKFLNLAGETGGYVSGIVTVRSSLAIATDGNSITEDAVIELIASDGANVGTFPFSTTHVRVSVEPPPALATPDAGTPTT